MEEDIKIIEELIKNEHGELLNCWDYGEEAKKALENLLTRYKQLEEENIHWRGQYYLENRKYLDLYNKKISIPTINATEEMLQQYIPKSKVKEQIKWLDNDIKNTKYKLEQGKRPYPNYIGEHRRLRMKAFITKSKEIRDRLKKILEEE